MNTKMIVGKQAAFLTLGSSDMVVIRLAVISSQFKALVSLHKIWIPWDTNIFQKANLFVLFCIQSKYLFYH